MGTMEGRLGFRLGNRDINIVARASLLARLSHLWCASQKFSKLTGTEHGNSLTTYEQWWYDFLNPPRHR